MSDVIYNISSGFFDSVNGDRLYSAADMNKPYKRVIADGIFPTPQGTPSTDFQVVAVSGMSVAVLAGNAMIGARWAENTDDVGITIAGNSSSSPRIDSIFLHIDTGMDTRAAGVVYRQGTAAGTPTAPAMVQTDNITELRLADILVAPSAAIITQANITDQRGGSDCPWVAGLIQQVDTSALFDQYRAAYAEQQQDQADEWNTFMDHLARDYDISMSLRKHESTYMSTAAASLIPINIDGYDTTKDLLQVYINGIFAVEGTHYIVKSAAQIQLTNAISAGQNVHFVIYKAVMGGAQPIIPTDEQVQDAVDAYMDAHPGALVVDPELSDTSTHAIQNKAVTEALAGVNGRLDELTETSANLLNVTWANARYDNGVYKPLTIGTSYAATVEKIAVNADTTYTVTWDGFNLASGSVMLYCQMFTDSQTFIRSVTFSLGTNYTRQSKQITTESNAAYIVLFFYSSGAAWENLIPINAMLTEGTDVPDSYVPPVKLNPNAIDKADIAEIVNESNIVPETIFNATSRNIAVDAWEPGRYNPTTKLPEYRASNNILIRPIMDVDGGATYTCTWGNNEAEAGQVYLLEFAGDTYVKETSIPYAKRNLSVALAENTTKVGLQMFLSGGTISTMRPDFIQLEKGSASPFVHHDVMSVDRFDLVEAERHNKGCDIPSYYFEDGYLTAKAERLNALMKKAVGHGDAFVFITDEHWEKNQKKSPALVYYLAGNTNINSFIGGGDTADVVSEDCCAAFRMAFSGSIHRSAGNHDWFSPSTGSLIYYCFDMYNNDQNGNANEHYYYFDNVNQKIRYIVLNAYTSGSGADNASSSLVTGYTSEQITWLTNVLSESTGKNIIVVTHYMGTTLTNSPNGAEAIRNALDSHNANSETGKVLAVVQGHTHYDALFCTAGGIPIITCTCDKNEPYYSGSTTLEPWLNNRASGTIDEQAFDVDIVDTVAKTVHSVRIGAKAMANYSGSSETGFVSDMTIEERIIHFEKIILTSQHTLTASIDDITAWGTSNASVCTVSDGVVSRSGSGVAYVYATNSKGESENWVIVA